MNIIIVLVFCVIVLIGFVVLVFFCIPGKQGNEKKNASFRGICGFDIDKTLTCGKLSDLKAAVHECKANNFALAVVTARVLPVVFPVNTTELGFPEYYPIKHGNLSFSEHEQAETKAKQLHELMHYFNSRQREQIQKSQVYLFDDKKSNVDAANKNGFMGVHVSNCNLNQNMVKKALYNK